MSRRQNLPHEVLTGLASLVAAVASAERLESDWEDQVTIHFLRNFTVEPIEPYLKFHIIRDDVKPRISYGGYDTMSQEILDPESALNRHPPDLIILALIVDLLAISGVSAGGATEIALLHLNELVDRLINRTSSLIVANTFIGPIAQYKSDTKRDINTAEITTLNDRLREIAAEYPNRFVLSDWQDLITVSGKDDAIDFRFWATSQAPFKASFLKLYAQDIAGYARAVKGRSKKCLVLDCDNTLWGGVVGEDGFEEIELHPTQCPGAYYYQFQESLLSLCERGVMLALCSKNNEHDVLEVIDQHPHCLVKSSSLVAWRVNWEDKAKNIQALAAELNIGLDSIVFLDDSQHECALVANMLPEVTVIRVPENLDSYPRLVTSSGLFTVITQSAEDRRRTELYQSEHRRAQGKSNYRDLEDYLRSLKTTVHIARASAGSLARIAQLTQKTNQFNLTTRRYSESEIRAFSEDKDIAVYAMTVSDGYGDMGLTGVFIARRRGKDASIDSMLLSCRVLGRQLEVAFADVCMKELEEAWGLETWSAEFLPTKKNAQVSDFWDRLGLSYTGSAGDSKLYSGAAGPRPSSYSNIMSVTVE